MSVAVESRLRATQEFSSFTTLSEEDVSIRRVHFNGFIRGPLIGTGSYGSVYEGFSKAEKRCVALKVYTRERSSLQAGVLTAGSQVAREIDILRRLRRSAFIVEYITDFTLANNTRVLAMGIVRGCNLHKLVEQATAKGVRLPVSQTRHILWATLSGLAHLKDHGLVHGDLKPENILVSSTSEVKLSDFGCSFEPGDKELAKDILAGQSPAFQAPNVAQGLDLVDVWSPDMWSVGIVCYLMVTGIYPFDMQELALLDVMEKVSRAEYTPPKDDFTGMVSSLMCVEADRLTLEQAFKHVFLSGYDGIVVNAAVAATSVAGARKASARPPARLSKDTWQRRAQSEFSVLERERVPQVEQSHAACGWFFPIAQHVSFVDGVVGGGSGSDADEDEENVDYDALTIASSMSSLELVDTDTTTRTGCCVMM